MGDNAYMHTATQARSKVRELRKDQPKKVLDNYFRMYQQKHREKLSEPALAEMMKAKGYGVDQTTINRIRHGKLYPDIETALKFSNFLEMEFMEFVGLEFWTSPPPETYLTIPARDVARTFDGLTRTDREAVKRIITALAKTSEK